MVATITSGRLRSRRSPGVAPLELLRYHVLRPHLTFSEHVLSTKIHQLALRLLNETLFHTHQPRRSNGLLQFALVPAIGGQQQIGLRSWSSHLCHPLQLLLPLPDLLRLHPRLHRIIKGCQHGVDVVALGCHKEIVDSLQLVPLRDSFGQQSETRITDIVHAHLLRVLHRLIQRRQALRPDMKRSLEILHGFQLANLSLRLIEVVLRHASGSSEHHLFLESFTIVVLHCIQQRGLRFELLLPPLCLLEHRFIQPDLLALGNRCRKIVDVSPFRHLKELALCQKIHVPRLRLIQQVVSNVDHPAIVDRCAELHRICTGQSLLDPLCAVQLIESNFRVFQDQVLRICLRS
mmetsp:Transcript_47772/g.126447  ORF Transcript_47772/g.126447 Transcript_47772/m.126447 type:complete len:348 (+) Transcript_47772:216-1259(+)